MYIQDTIWEHMFIFYGISCIHVITSPLGNELMRHWKQNSLNFT